MSKNVIKLEHCKHDDSNEMGFQYSFVDYIISGYTGQDNVQVCAILQLLCSSVQKKHPDVKEIFLQSDNATCFSSQAIIHFIHHLNAENPSVTINKWIFTDAQTGCGRLDTHFSYVNIVLKSYVEDGNDIDMEEDICKALLYHDGLSGTTVVLVDGSRLKAHRGIKALCIYLLPCLCHSHLQHMILGQY
jgi:hypothetical protein